MLSYEEFKRRLVDEILDYLPGEYFDCDVTIEKVVKNNNSINEGLMIRHRNSNISPNIYIKQFYDEYVDGDLFENICMRIANLRIETDYRREFDVSTILDYDSVKDFIFLSIVNREKNSNQLYGRPHRDYLDLAIVYYIDVSGLSPERMESKCMQLGITNELMDSYGVSEEELYDIAFSNTNREKGQCRYLHEVMIDMVSEKMFSEGASKETIRTMAEDIFTGRNYNIMYLTNSTGCKGSAMLFNNRAMHYASEKLGGDFYVLPSSIHEVVLVSALACMQRDDMINMVKEVNRNTVNREDFLSDNIYYYDHTDDRIYMMAE